MTSQRDTYKKLKSLSLEEWALTFWLIKRKIVDREARYSVLRVDIDPKLAKRFREYIKQQLQTRDSHLETYEFTNADTDNALRTLDTDTTDFPKIEAEINKSFDNNLAREYNELLNSWAYIVQLQKAKDSLYAWRKINTTTNPKKVRHKKAIFFNNHKLIDIDETPVFLIDTSFDFFVFDGHTFIANKREFESSLNFREGIKAHGNALLDEFSTMNFLSNVEVIREYVSNNLNHLKKLASIRKSGYYQMPDYVKRLMHVCLEEHWELKIVNKKIIVEIETIDLLLKLLNNERLRSPINNELFDASVKKAVQSK